jgi:hypothetical protein
MGSQDNAPDSGETVPQGTPVNAEKTDLNALLQEAYDGPDELDENETAAPAAETASTVETPDASKGAQPVVDSGTPDASSEPASGGEAADAPERYFEVDLSGLPVEERAKIIEALKGRDDEIGQLLRGRAEGEAPPPAEEPEPAAPVSDEDILTTLGIDPEFDETAAKVAIPLVRGMQALQDQVSQLLQQGELRELDQYWTSELTALETEHGVLPVDRVAVLEYAAANGIQSPSQAYWSIAGPARRQVEAAADAARARLSTAPPAKVKPGKKDVSSQRPANTDANEDIPVADGRSVRDAVKDQAAKVLADLGIGT